MAGSGSISQRHGSADPDPQHWYKIYNLLVTTFFLCPREEEEYIVSDGLKQIPIKWTAPEALNYGKYTSLCDIWSYGVLVWEIFSKGGTPYQGSFLIHRV
jgi:hypothetical protein